jgi:hypothetical protein
MMGASFMGKPPEAIRRFTKHATTMSLGSLCIFIYERVKFFRITVFEKVPVRKPPGVLSILLGGIVGSSPGGIEDFTYTTYFFDFTIDWCYKRNIVSLRGDK